MKKFLSLVLALAMTLSLVTISAGAKDFTDDSDIAYKEAVDVISALNIVDGYSDDSFRPDGVLTRGAAAKIICNLILGPTTASALSASTAPFKDVPVTNTFAGYITYCSQQGIINGYADGTFRPTDTLSGNAFMKMLLGALGYDSSIEGYTGANWTVNVIKQAMGIGLDDGNDEFVGSKAVTRQEAALYAFNMLQSTLVEYDAKTTVNVNGATVTIAGDKAQDKAWGTGINNDGNIDKDGFVQFAEQYFGDLKLYDDTDDFGRPSNMWRLDGVKLGTYPREADVTYTAKVKSGDIYRDLGLNHTVNASKVTVYENGEADSDWSLSIKRSSDDAVHNTANGVLTEVFYDSDADEIVITTVDTYVGTINRSVAAKGDDPAFVEISVGGEHPAGVSGVLEFETDEEFEDDAYVLYTYSQAVDEVKSVALAEEVTGTVTKSENNDTNLVDGKAVTIDDADRYVASKNLDEIDGEKLGDINVDEEYTIYLDAYGYLIYVEEVENNNYALVTAAASKSDFIGKKAELVFADGSTEIVNTDKYYGGNELGAGLSIGDRYHSGDAVIVTYRVDEDGVYKLKAVDTTVAKGNNENFVLTNDKAGIVVDKVSGKDVVVTANSASTFVVGETGEDPANIDEYTAYTGIKNAPSIKTSAEGASDNKLQADTYYYCKSGKMVTIMFVLPEANLEVEDGVSKMLFLAKESVGNLEHDRNGDYFVYNAVVDDEITTVKVADDVKVDGAALTWSSGSCSHGTGTAACQSYSEHVKNTLNGLYKSYSVDKYGIITNLKTFDTSASGNDNFSYTDGEQGYLTGTGIDKYNKEYTVIVGASKTTITCEKDATYFYVDEDGEITSRTYNAIAKDSDDEVYLYAKDYMVQTLFVEQVEPAKVPYGVTVPTGNFANATVYVDGDKVAPGKSAEYERNDEDVVITVVPKDGYYFASAPEVNGVAMTKKDDGSYTYTISRIRGEYNVTGEATKIPDETMNIQVSYVLSDGTEIKSVAPDKYEEDGTTGFAKVDGTVNLPENYQIVGKKVEYVPFVANTSDNVTFTVARATAGLTLPTGVTATWAADASKGITNGSASDGATTQVPVGAAVTLTGINGSCGKNGEALPDKTFDMPAAGKAIDADSFGYVAVTVKDETANIADSGMNTAGYTVTASMEPAYVKVSTASTVTVKISVTNTADGTTLRSARNVAVSTASCSATNGTGLIASTQYGTTAVEYDLTVSVNVAADTELEFTVSQ